MVEIPILYQFYIFFMRMMMMILFRLINWSVLIVQRNSLTQYVETVPLRLSTIHLVPTTHNRRKSASLLRPSHLRANIHQTLDGQKEVLVISSTRKLHVIASRSGTVTFAARPHR